MANAKTNTPKLPDGILKSDLKPGTWKTQVSYPDDSFELWYTTGFGWCIPTLVIKNAGIRAAFGGTRRTYATRVATGAPVRIGHGPHVTATVRVHVKKTRLKALQHFLDLRLKGAEDANVIRDRISSRRAASALRRSYF